MGDPSSMIDETVTLASEALEAVFAPAAGMVGCSLRHRGTELLGLRGGLEAYRARGMTFGIPLLYPWANRLSERRFEVAGRDVDLDPDRAPVRLDEHDLPIHGLMAAASGWAVEAREATRLAARFDWGAHRALMTAFPFAHELAIEMTLDGATLTIRTVVDASAGAPVPIAFGFHPYLQLPDVPRADWQVEIPSRERLELDERTLPTGRRQPVEPFSGTLGSRTFDDAYTAPPARAPFVLAGGGRRIELTFDAGYGYAQVFAPASEDLIAFEPMTAPANALVTGPPVLEPGERLSASFSITVHDA
jgi:galactose mutarotase-like enzyme